LERWVGEIELELKELREGDCLLREEGDRKRAIRLV